MPGWFETGRIGREMDFLTGSFDLGIGELHSQIGIGELHSPVFFRDCKSQIPVADPNSKAAVPILLLLSLLRLPQLLIYVLPGNVFGLTCWQTNVSF